MRKDMLKMHELDGTTTNLFRFLKAFIDKNKDD